jgi:hypothetical protein
MALAFAFDPVFVFVALGVSGLVLCARLILGWALRE